MPLQDMGRESRANQARRAAEIQAINSAEAESKAVGGVNPSERYLAGLCRRTFLSLWSYPNIYRSTAKELGDLLVVFENDVILFSDKFCAFGNSGDLRLDWSRWYRKAIAKSAQQLWRAEQWIINHPDRLFLDAKCHQAFPLALPKRDSLRTHLVVVAHGAFAACRRHFGGGSGSLIVDHDVHGDAHYEHPFTVGLVDPTQTFVHVLDDTTLDVLLNKLDTVSDFVEYLRKKAAFVTSGRLTSAGGEEELLAHVNEQKDHDFVIPHPAQRLTLVEGSWLDFLNSPEHTRQLEADKISYMWDRLIERFNRHFLEGTALPVGVHEIKEHELLMRFFAREGRTRRRMLARALYDVLENTPPHLRMLRVIHPSRVGDPLYVLLALPWREDRPGDENRHVRREFLLAVCQVAKAVFPHVIDIVGFATETDLQRVTRSEDALYLDARVWTEEQQAEAIDLQQKLSILTNYKKHEGVEYEYPKAPQE